MEKLQGFKDWLTKMEAMTSTADVANYSRPALPMIRREIPSKKRKENKDEGKRIR